VISPVRVHLSPRSANAKVGPIPVSTSSEATCPPACPHIRDGCYASYGPLSLHWRAVSNDERGDTWHDFCRKIHKLPQGQLWRHNQAGDLPGRGNTIDPAALATLIASNSDKRGFTYTHKPMTPANLEAVAACNRHGFTVNLSADSLRQADRYAALGIGPVCVVVPSDAPNVQRTPAGRKVVVCPAARQDLKRKVTCATCAICADSKRKTIIAFPAHGTAKVRVSLRVVSSEVANGP
jgi:hypothetical protein